MAQAPTTVAVHDRADAGDGAPDLKRVAATRTSGGGLRLALSLFDELAARDLLAAAATGGPPGSLCVRLWTAGSPRTARADLLACVTARADGRTLRATVSEEATGQLPATVTSPEVTRPSPTSVVLRIAPGLLGSARRIIFAAEATAPGCARLSCVDLAPEAGGVRTLRLYPE